MTAIHADLRTILEAVTIQSPTRFSISGEPSDLSTTGKATTADASLPPPVRFLYDSLYARLYTRSTTQGAPSPIDELARHELMAALSAANSGRGTWDTGWTIEHHNHDGRLGISKEGITFLCSPADIRPRNAELKKGEKCSVRISNELRNRFAGFYLAIGDCVEDDGDPREPAERIFRFYWHLTAASAVPFMATACDLFNAAGIPFRLKVVSAPEAYTRADAGILYLSRRYLANARILIAQIYQSIAPGLRPLVPLFTSPLADGLAIAQDPRGPLSFGQHRCKLVATALWRSFMQGEVAVENRAATLATIFRDEGLDPMRPHLGPESVDDNALSLDLSCFKMQAYMDSSGNRRHALLAGSPGCPSTLSAKCAAVRIGENLCRDAVWDSTGRLCNWMGRPSKHYEDGASPVRLSSVALGPELYGGTAGVAFFLAQLHAITAEPEFLRVAAGAITCAIRQLERSPHARTASPVSFFCAHLGAAYVARLISESAPTQVLMATVELMLDGPVTHGMLEPHDFDLIGGNAGAITPLIRLGQVPGLERCREMAITLGEQLCQTADVQGPNGLWNKGSVSGAARSGYSMPGFAHGAAGFGLALLEVFAITQRVDFVQAARRAFAFVDAALDQNRVTWSNDRRLDGSHGAVAPPRLSFTWCHGAPGIALSSLRAALLDRECATTHLGRAQRALATTLVAIDEMLNHTRPDLSLCHGLSGLGEVTLIASQSLREPSYHERADSLARVLIDRYAASGDWPSGVPSGGPNPSLMLGLAGIGYWLLRLHDPAKVPPILLFVP